MTLIEILSAFIVAVCSFTAVTSCCISTTEAWHRVMLLHDANVVAAKATELRFAGAALPTKVIINGCVCTVKTSVEVTSVDKVEAITVDVGGMAAQVWLDARF